MNERARHIKDYLCRLFVDDEVMLEISQRAKEAALPPIEVPAYVGKLLYLLAKLQRPGKILEIGMLAGYSTVWLARALVEGGSMISLEVDPECADLAQKHLALAGVEDKVEIRLGRAKVLMEGMIKRKEGPFDVIFIDADKENYSLYLDLAIQLSRPGTLILTDNLIPKGDNIGHPENFEGEFIYAFNQKMASHPRLESILTPTIVRDQGQIDALGISVVKA